MSDPSNSDTVQSVTTRLFFTVLIAIAFLTAIPAWMLGAKQFIEYDGYWHIFIAQQDHWSRFWEDIKANAHPPLYFFLLKAVMHLGHSFLVYRSISLISQFFCVVLIGTIARSVTSFERPGASSQWGWLAAAAYGLALPAIIVACEVRSYMLSTVFVLLSFWFLLKILSVNGEGDDRPWRFGFAAAAVLACYSHYFAFFYAGVTVLALAIRCVLRKASWRTEAATIVPVVALIGALFVLHGSLHAIMHGHLIHYYYDSSKDESTATFLVRNSGNFVRLFAPFPVPSDYVAAAIMASCALAGLGLVAYLLNRTSIEGVQARWTVMLTGAMLAGIILASLAGKYPFGGDLRQQFLLFPFLVLCGAIGSAALVRFLPQRSQAAVPLMLLVPVIWVSSKRFNEYPKISSLSDGMSSLVQAAGDPEAVYLDQFNLILFFTHHHSWQWKLIRTQNPLGNIDAYRISEGARSMLVFRDKDEWNLDPTNLSLYDKFKLCLQVKRVNSVTTLVVLESQTPPLPAGFQQVANTVISDAAGSGICAQRVDLAPDSWFASFRQEGKCASPMVHTAPPPDRVFSSTVSPTTKIELFAIPMRIVQTDGSGLGITDIYWHAPPGVRCEVHVNSPDGPVFAAGTGSGHARTNKWVKDGTQFFLQDVTGGKPPSEQNTRARIKISVTS